jgi:phage terminase large subunit-like protein
VLACYLACLCDYSDCLSLGETGVLLVLAKDQKQARIVFKYIAAILEEIPALRAMIANQTQESISLTNGIEIEIRAASFRGLRGVTCIACICDEIATWFTEADNSANSDTEILDVIRPAMGTTNGLLACISSPRAKNGELGGTYQVGEQRGRSTRILRQRDISNEPPRPQPLFFAGC